MRVFNKLTNQLAPASGSSLPPPCPRACFNCINFARKALGRNHIAPPASRASRVVCHILQHSDSPRPANSDLIAECARRSAMQPCWLLSGAPGLMFPELRVSMRPNHNGTRHSILQHPYMGCQYPFVPFPRVIRILRAMPGILHMATRAYPLWVAAQ